jgi:acetoin utilization deacetylase AcuC-like enzyme
MWSFQVEDIVLYYPDGHEAHAAYGHPERPERVEVIKTAFIEADIWHSYRRLEPQPIAHSVLEDVHDKDYLDRLKHVCESGMGVDLETYTTKASWNLAMNAVGGAIAVARSVWHKESKRGLALTRPPGHHATIDRGMGFCLLNNVAIAAEHLLQVDGAIRLAIIDLDLHHGNGTQDIFWSREDVLYISIHQYPHYPGTGNLHEVGTGYGEGTTANFPMPAMSGDLAYETVIEEIILKLLDRYNPDMILVSYGFDTHWKDPLGQVLLSAGGYAKLITQLSKWADNECKGKIALFLEGGYDLDAAKACTLGVVAALLDQEWEDPIGPSPFPETSTWQGMFNQARRIWGL